MHRHELSWVATMLPKWHGLVTLSTLASILLAVLASWYKTNGETVRFKFDQWLTPQSAQHSYGETSL